MASNYVFGPFRAVMCQRTPHGLTEHMTKSQEHDVTKLFPGKKRVCPCHVTSSCCLERVPEKSSGRGSWNIVVKKGSWHVVRKRFVTYCQEGVPDMLWSRKGSWHVARKGFIPYRQERVLNMSSGRVSKHVVRKGFLTYMYILYVLYSYICLLIYIYIYIYIYMYILSGARSDHFTRKGS